MSRETDKFKQIEVDGEINEKTGKFYMQFDDDEPIFICDIYDMRGMDLRLVSNANGEISSLCFANDTEDKSFTLFIKPNKVHFNGM